MRRPRCVLCLILALLGWGGVVPLPAQRALRTPDILTFQTFDKRGGLQPSAMNALALDHDGLLWVGTDDGAAYFTGHSWTRVDMPRSARVNQVRDMLFTPDGARWFATRGGGVIRFGAAGDTTHWTTANSGLSEDTVYDLAEVTAFGEPTVVAATYSGLVRLENDRFVPVTLPDNFAPTGLIVTEVSGPDGSGELYLGSPNDGILRWRDGAWERIGPLHGLMTYSVEAFAVPAPGSGAPRLYAAGDDGVFALRGDRWTRVEGAPAPAYRVSEVIRADSSRELWVGTTDGELWRRAADARWHPVVGGAIRAGDAITLIAPVPRASGEPMVYVGLRGERLTRIGLTATARPNVPLPSDSRAIHMVRQIVMGGVPELWVGTTAPGAVRIVDGVGQVEGDDPALGLGPVRSLTKWRDTLWVAGLTGVARYVEGQWIRSMAGLGGAAPRRFGSTAAATADGELLLGTDQGVRVWRDERWVPWDVVPLRLVDDFALVTDSVGGVPRTSLYVTGDRGNIWEVRDGVARAMIGERDSVAKEQVTDLLVEPRPGGGARLWASTAGLGGIRLYDLSAGDAAWRIIDSDVRAALPSEFVRDLVRDRDGRIYAATSRGVAQLRPEPDGSVVLETLYGREEGLPSADVIKLARLASGELLAGTMTGIGRLATEVPDPTRQLPLWLKVTDAASMPLSSGTRLSHDAAGLTLEFALLNYFREEDTRYRTELVGAPGGPSDWLPRHDVSLQTLAAGSYRFRVWARDYRGQVVGPAEFAFSVAPPWWLSGPAKVGWAVLVLACFGGVLAWRHAVADRRARDLEARELRARHSATRFRALFDRSLDAHLLLDGDRAVAANAAAVRMFGAPDLATLMAEGVARHLPPPPDAPGTGVVEVEVRRRDDSIVPAHAAWTPIPAEDGHTLLHLVLRDLSATRAAEAERQRLEAQVREAQKFESLGTMAGGIAHDFNNLLTVIRGSAEEALESVPTVDGEPLRRILDVSDRARDLVRQILTFSRRSPGGAHVPVDLVALVRGLEPLLRSSMPRTVTLALDLPSAPVVVLGDPTQLQQIILNLTANAEHAMRGRHGSMTVRVTEGAPEERMARLEVRDTGRGMPEAVIARVFEPFFTTKPVGEGTGLGLAVLHGIVTSHGGTVGVESAPDRGTTFTITLPHAAELTPASPQAASPPQQLRVPGVAILVVDDDPEVLDVTTRLLRALGHRPTSFGEPRSALEWLAATSEPVECLLTDQTMPGLTGDQLVEAARALRPGLPSLIITGFSHVLTPERIVEVGVHAVLHKPVDRRDLAAAIAHAVAGPAPLVAD